MKIGNLKWAMGLVLAASVFAGCAQDVGDIDRTQPNKIEKSVFQNNDEWYFRQMVIDTDFQGSAGLFNGLESSLKRVRWVIQEDTLYAMSTVEPVDGVYDGYESDDSRRVGVVAAFPIQGHFDVQRSYNSSTGERSNVISENGSDREWFDRKFMRVDWSRNLVDGFGMFGSGAGSMSTASFNVPQQDGKVDPNRTRISDNYIDATTQYYYEPDIYACYYAFGLDSIYTCEGGTVSVRNSFLKLDEVETYEPLEYLDTEYLRNDEGDRLLTMRLYDQDLQEVFNLECSDKAKELELLESGSAKEDACEPASFDLFSRFGYFRTERVTWDEEYGAGAEDNRHYYANRWNIWETVYNDDGSVMDMKDRSPQPITYYLNVEFPEDMYAPSQEVARQWDASFKESVMLAKGSSMSDLEGDLEARYGHKSMYRIERNSCSAEKLAAWNDANGDVDGIFADLGSDVAGEFAALSHREKHHFCAGLELATEGNDTAFTYERVGDLRYSFFNWVEQEVPWLGYGPSAADPTTGEIISGNANFNGTAMRTYGPIAADYIQYANGEITDDELRLGTHIRKILDKKNNSTREQALTAEGKRELASRSGKPVAEISPTNFNGAPALDELPEFVLQNSVGRIEQEARRVSLDAEMTKSSDTRASEFYGQPGVQNYLMKDGNLRRMAEANALQNAGPEFTDADVRDAYLDLSVPNHSIDRYERRNNYLAERNILSLEHMEDMITNLVTYAGVADHFKDADRDEIAHYFVRRMFVGTQLHEVGHTVGLRHNFIASTDVLNYHDTYWDIQEAIANGVITEDERWSVPAAKTAEVVPNLDLGEKGVASEYVNEAEFRIASVMDYTSDFTGRFAGLGKYDQAAINFAYAEKVETWNDETMGDVSNFYDIELWLSHYREIPRIMSGAGGTGLGSSDQIVKGIDHIKNGRIYVDLKEAKLQKAEGLRANRKNWEEYRTALEAGNPGATPSLWIDPTVPYEFCSDEYNGSQLGCTVFDWGANQQEIVNHTFNNYRLFNTYRRYNRHKIYKGYENIQSFQSWIIRTFATASTPFRYYSIYQWYDLGSYTDDLREAAIDSVNFFGEVIATPEPGRYCMFDTANTALNTYWFYDLDEVYLPADWDRNDGRCSNYVDVDRGWGQMYDYSYTNDYDFRISRVGTFIDKSIATVALFDINSSYLYSSFFTDFRATNISYWTLFKDELYGYLRGIIMGDFKAYSGSYNPTTLSYEPPEIIDTETFGLGLPNSQAGLKKIYTPMSFSHEFNILVGAMIYNTTWEDRYTDFGQYAKISVGYSESQEYAPGTELKTFIHPLTNQIYTAPIAADGRSITGELVDWANSLKVRYEEQKDVLDAATPGTDAYLRASEQLEGRSQQLEEVVAKMDMIRYIWQALGANALR